MSDSATGQTSQQREMQAIGEAMDELRQSGWLVVELGGSRVDWLPESLRGYEPDFVARRGNEILIGQVKSRNSEGLEELDDLAKAVAVLPNARLEILWRGDESEINPAHSRVREYADEARVLLRTDHRAAAALIAWAAVEGALIYYVTDQRISLPDRPNYMKTPWQLLSYLDSLGHINDADLKRLTELRRQRNAAAHFAGREDPNPDDIAYCLGVVDRMLSGRYVSVDQMMEWFVEHYDYPDVPVEDADRDRIRASLVDRFPGAPESDIEEVLTGVIHDAAL